MSYGLKLKEPLSFVTSSQANEQRGKAKREITISFGQLCALWAVVAAMMFVVFFFGVHAGLDQGLKRALDEQDVAVLRYPLPTNRTAEADAKPSEPARGVLARDGFSGTAEPEKFDFSGVATQPGAEPAQPAEQPVTAAAEPKPVVEAVPSAGLTAKTTTEILDVSKSAPTAITSKPIVEEPAPSVDAVAPKLAKPEPAKKTEVVARNEQRFVPEPLEPETRPDTRSASKGTRVISSGSTDDKPAASEKFRPGTYVQVAAPTSRSEADATLRKLTRSGLSGRVVEGRVNGVLYFRVVVGPAKNRRDADALRARVERSGASAGKPFVKTLP